MAKLSEDTWAGIEGVSNFQQFLSVHLKKKTKKVKINFSKMKHTDVQQQKVEAYNKATNPDDDTRGNKSNSNDYSQKATLGNTTIFFPGATRKRKSVHSKGKRQWGNLTGKLAKTCIPQDLVHRWDDSPGARHPHRGAADADGVVASAARKRKEKTYPEIVGPRSRARLVVLAVEVGGRWSSETRSFIAQLAKARSRQEPLLLRRRAEQVWRMRWGAFLSCVAAKAVASSFLESRCAQGADGDTPPSWEVEADHRHAGLAP